MDRYILPPEIDTGSPLYRYIATHYNPEDWNALDDGQRDDVLNRYYTTDYPVAATVGGLKPPHTLPSDLMAQLQAAAAEHSRRTTGQLPGLFGSGNQPDRGPTAPPGTRPKHPASYVALLKALMG